MSPKSLITITIIIIHRYYIAMVNACTMYSIHSHISADAGGLMEQHSELEQHEQYSTLWAYVG